MPYRHLFSVVAEHLQTLIIAGGYPFLFLTVLLEGVPLIGTFIPGHVTIIAGGFLARIGVLDLYWVIALSIIAAILGDCIGFYLGRKYGLTLIDRLRPYFFITDAHIAKAQALLAKHSGKSMIIGRFSPVTRALMPFLVGASPIPTKRFWLFNVIGAVSWATLSILLGYAFGAGYTAVAGYFGKLVVIAILAALLILWGYRFINQRFHIFARYELFMLGLNLVSLWGLSETIQDAVSRAPFLASLDVYVNLFMAQHVTPLLADIAFAVTDIGGTAVTASLGVALGVYFAIRHKWRSSAIMLLSIASTAAAVGVMKEFFLRARPENALQLLVNDPSFPSGHAALAAAFFIVIAYLFAPRIHSWIRRELLVVACVLSFIAVGVSRVVLNVHWVSDVLCGWSLGIFLATASILFVKYVGVLVANKGR